MKKTIFTFLLVACISFVACAKDKYSRDVTVLPAAAQNTLKSYFKADVSLIKVDSDWGRVSEYDVTLTDGTEITFDRGGNWKEIEVKRSGSVPMKLVPDGVKAYVNTHHKGQKIIGIEKDRKGYDVELSNGLDLEFSTTGEFLRYDD